MVVACWTVALLDLYFNPRRDGWRGFAADSVLAKHDENYMPAEVKKSLEERGVKLGSSAHPDGETKK